MDSILFVSLELFVLLINNHHRKTTTVRQLRLETIRENTPVTEPAIPEPNASTAIATRTSITAYSTVVTPLCLSDLRKEILLSLILMSIVLPFLLCVSALYPSGFSY